MDDTISVQPSTQFRAVMIGDNDGFLDLLHFQRQHIRVCLLPYTDRF